MSPAVFIVALILGAAALGFWTDARFPGLEPRSIIGRLVNAGIASFVIVLVPVPQSPGALQMLALIGLFLPALSYAFLTGIWLLRTLQGALLRS